MFVWLMMRENIYSQDQPINYARTKFEYGRGLYASE